MRKYCQDISQLARPCCRTRNSKQLCRRSRESIMMPNMSTDFRFHSAMVEIHATAVKQLDTPYPVIDADPHFSRVVRSFRGSDYVAMAGATAAFPSAIYLMEMFDPTRPKRGMGSALRLSTFLGLCGGFLFAYQRSSFRFWGWRENELEQAANQAAIDAGIKPPGTDPSKSDLTPYMQGVAHRNSAFSQLKFSKCCMQTGMWISAVERGYLLTSLPWSNRHASLVQLGRPPIPWWKQLAGVVLLDARLAMSHLRSLACSSSLLHDSSQSNPIQAFCHE